MKKAVASALALFMALAACPSAAALVSNSWDQWLPALNREYTYYGLAEYGHRGRLILVSRDSAEAIYEFCGRFSDGYGDESRFAVRYHVDMPRGTVTEQAVSNERGKPEVNSRLHNLVVLKFPLSTGERWSHKTSLNGEEVTVNALVTEYNESKGVVKVRYTAAPAPEYFGNTYIETRTYEKGLGMTAFANLMPGDIGLSAADSGSARKINEALAQRMFGYSLNKAFGQSQ